MKTGIQFRQGDVLLERIDSIPDTAEKQTVTGRVILAHGTVTGHHHSVAAVDAELWKAGEELFVDVMRATNLEHQEHAAIELPIGAYRVTRQQEYSPEAIRNVED